MIRDNDAISDGISSVMLVMFVVVKFVLEGLDCTNTDLVGVAIFIKVEQETVTAILIEMKAFTYKKMPS